MTYLNCYVRDQDEDHPWMGFLPPNRWIRRATDLYGSLRPASHSSRRRGLAPAGLLLLLQVLLELVEGVAVDHAPLLDPGPPRLRDAVPHEAESPLVVGVRVDGDADARSYRLADVGNSEVEAVHVRVELQGRVSGGGLPYEARDFHLIRLPAV